MTECLLMRYDLALMISIRMARKIEWLTQSARPLCTGHTLIALDEGDKAPSLYAFGGAILPGGSYKAAYTAGTNEMLKFTFANGSTQAGTWSKVATVGSQVPVGER